MVATQTGMLAVVTQIQGLIILRSSFFQAARWMEAVEAALLALIMAVAVAAEAETGAAGAAGAAAAEEDIYAAVARDVKYGFRATV